MVLSEKKLYSLGRRCVYIFNRRKAKRKFRVKHGWGSAAARPGADGHKRIETTLRCSHLGAAHLQEAVERLTLGATDTRTDTSENQALVLVEAATA